MKSTSRMRWGEIPWWRIPVAQYLKYLSTGILGVSVVILILGLIYMPRYSLSEDQTNNRSKGSLSGDGTSTEESSALTLVDVVKKYSERFAAPAPPKKNDKNTVDNNLASSASTPPSPPPPPPPPPPTPPPAFKLEGTVMIGENVGIAWITLQGKTQAEAYFPGEVIQKYTLKQVESGQAHFERDGLDFTLKVPETARPALTAGAPPIPSMEKDESGRPRSSPPPPGNPNRPTRRMREPHP